MAGVLDAMSRIFGNHPAPVAAPVVNNNPTQTANPQMPLPGSDPQNPMIPAGDPASQSTALDQFAKLWETPATDPNAPADPNNYFATLDPAKVRESARKVNFTSDQVSPELAAAIAAGGPEALKAVQTLINQSSQNVYGQSALATASIVQKALDAQRENFQKALPGILKGQLVADSLATENPIFNNPALQPMVEMARQQVLQKFPNATQAETKEQIVTFFNAMQQALAPKPVITAAQKSEQQDWDAWIAKDGQ